MTNKELFEKVNKLGVPLFTPEENVDVNQTLAEVVKSRDVRLWEHFPVLLASVTRQFPLDVRGAMNELKTASGQQAFFELMALSNALMEKYGLNTQYVKETFDLVSQVYSGFGDRLKLFRSELSHDDFLSVGDMKLSVDRLKLFLEDFLNRKDQETRMRSARLKVLSLDFALSQLFTARQKELLHKKLNAEKLTKTEREYYSRAVKKKVQALANSDLHSLAQKLME